MKIANEVRKLQENPLLGKWRMSAALARMGIEVGPTTCGRIMGPTGNCMVWTNRRGPREIGDAV